MKALKEKRVSLRSLFRRSLVILSILALALASCGGDSDSGDDNGSPGITPTPPASVGKTVAAMQVLKHPSLPSYEGAEPDLRGIKVLVTWSDGTQEITDDQTKFTVYPPVAYTDGKNIEQLSKYGEYAIQYNADNYYDLNAYRVNVYIPAVIALSDVSGDDAPSLTSDYKDANGVQVIKEVFEDQGIKATGIGFKGKYNSLTKDPSTLTGPADWYYDLTPWGGAYADGGWQTNKVSSSPEAWLISARNRSTAPNISDATEKLANAVYQSDLGSGRGAGSEIGKLQIGIDKFYFVVSLTYKPGTGSIKEITADNAALTGYTEDDLTGYTGLPSTAVADTTLAVKKAWYDWIKDSGFEFTVTYYSPDPANPLGGRATRDIKMIDYVKAMYRMGPEYEDGNNDTTIFSPKASLPYLVGNEDTASELIDSIENEYYTNLALSLYYYSPAITGEISKGIVDLGTTDYITPDAANVPIGDYIYTYTRLEVARIDSTVNDGKPEIKSGKGTTDGNALSLYKSLQKYWGLFRVYTNSKGVEYKEKQPLGWPEYNYTGSEYTFNLGNIDFEDDVVTEKTEGTATITIPASFISSAIEVDDAELPFNFWMIE